MPLLLEDKRAIVTNVNQIVNQAHSVIVAEYRGMTVDEMTELRKKARDADVSLRVVRNTLARRAVIDTDFECLQKVLKGPVVLAFSMREPGAAARVISDFVKTNAKLVVKGLSLGSQLLEAEAIDKMAKLPTYLEAISQLMSVIQAPITTLARTLKEPNAKLVRTIAAIREEKDEK
jgi:large subunit ribosomal protein L10